MATIEHISRKRFPTNWAELYALAYGECSALLSSFLEGTITVHELRELWERLDNIHMDRINNLIDQQAKWLSDRKPLE